MSDFRMRVLKRVAKLPPSAPSSCSADEERELSTLPWQRHWDSMRRNDDGFSVYKRGGDATASPKKSRTYVFLLHGVGYTSLSWSLLVSQFEGAVQFVAYDFRGHGTTTAPADDLSSDALCRDTVRVIESTIRADQAPDALWTPRVVLVGHSAGGAIATFSAAKLDPSWLCGLVLIDIVEETALRAFPAMRRAIAARPDAFSTPQEAIKWALDSDTVRNKEAARVSVPSQLFYDAHSQLYRWTVDLRATEPHWQGWYAGLSSLFLAVPCAKILILSGTDCLDRQMLIGQMQGKFQLAVLPEGGHAIQEDCPRETAAVLFRFLKRHNLVAPELSLPRLESASLIQHPGADV